MATLRYLAFLFGITTFAGLGLAACSDDSSPNPAATGGNSNGGSGGTAGNGGTSTGGTAGNGGATGDAWKKGVVGTSKGVITLAKNAGRIQGFTVSTSLKTMDGEFDAGDDGAAGTSGASGEAGSGGIADAGDEAGVPDTTPKVDFSGITPDFTEMWVPVPPYAYGANDEVKIAPEVAVVKPDGTVTSLHPFTDWPSQDFVWTCLGSYNVKVNDVDMRAYGGLSFDMADCEGRHFMISNMSNKVWEIAADGTKTVLVDNLTGPSTIGCHQGALLISTLPQYDDVVPVQGPSLKRVTLDGGAVTDIVTLPIIPGYANNTTTAICGTYPGTTKSVPIGMKIPFAVRTDGSFLIGDAGAKTIYAVSEDGQNVSVFTTMQRFTVSAILAPNDIVYTVEPPVVNAMNWSVALGTIIKAFDGSQWITLQELIGYDGLASNMSNQYIHVDCPANAPADADCQQPSGGFVKIMFGATPVIYIVDPIKGELIAIPLDMGGGVDAGDDGAAGSGGAGGEAGSGGAAGAAGTGGDSGSGGTGGNEDAGEPDADDASAE